MRETTQCVRDKKNKAGKEAYNRFSMECLKFRWWLVVISAEEVQKYHMQMPSTPRLMKNGRESSRAVRPGPRKQAAVDTREPGPGPGRLSMWLILNVMRVYQGGMTRPETDV